MSVTALRSLPYEEVAGWFSYFEAYPVGWREDMRTSKILQANGVETPMDRIFPSIAARMAHASKANIGSKLQGSQMLAMLLSARGGDKIAF